MDRNVLFHLTSGLFVGVKDPQCGLQQRALIAAELDDIVLFGQRGVARQPILDEIKWLNRMGLGPTDTNVYMLSSDDVRAITTNAPLSYSHARRLLGKRPVDVYAEVSFDRMLYEHAKRHGFRINGHSPEDSARANSKAYFQKCATDPALNIPDGMVVKRDEVPTALVQMLETCECVYLKPTDAATGQGHQPFLKSVDDLEPVDERFEDWVLQECLDKRADLSMQFTMKNGGVIEVHYTTQTINTSGHHTGNGSAINLKKEVALEILHQGTKLLGDYYGFMKDGSGSIDVVLDRNGTVWLVEVNFRKTSPVYVIDLFKRLYGKVIYFDMQGFSVPNNITGNELCTHFARVLYEQGAKQGFIPFCFLPQHNFCYGVVFAHDFDEYTRLHSMVGEAHARLAQL
ncbi:MAG: hypothetical protein ABIH21_05315 [Patescibacteria group bacterium]